MISPMDTMQDINICQRIEKLECLHFILRSTMNPCIFLFCYIRVYQIITEFVCFRWSRTITHSKMLITFNVNHFSNRIHNLHVQVWAANNISPCSINHWDVRTTNPTRLLDTWKFIKHLSRTGVFSLLPIQSSCDKLKFQQFWSKESANHTLQFLPKKN